MFKKILLTFLILSLSTLFAMSLSTLNSASKEELMQINGIGEKKAEAILKERKNGKFKSYEDLSSRVKGIGKQSTSNLQQGIKNGEKVTKRHSLESKKTSKKKSNDTALTSEKKKSKKSDKSTKKEKKTKSEKREKTSSHS